MIRQSRLRRSLRASVAEGLAAEVVGACSNSAVLTAWALHLRLAAPLVGLLGALPLSSQVFQLPGAWVAAVVGNRRTALWAVGVSRQLPWLLCLLPFVPSSLAQRQAALIAVATASAALSIVGNNGWTGWMGELVPPAVRGRYFGRRNALCALAAAVAGMGAGLTLDLGGARGDALASPAAGRALSLLTLLGCLAGVASSLLMSRQHQPRERRRARRLPALADALSPLRSPRSRRLLAFQAASSAATGFCAAFFPLYMVEGLGLRFLQISLYGAAASTAKMIAAPLAGRALDRRGAGAVLRVSAFGLCLPPLLWALSGRAGAWVLSIEALVGGALLAAQSLSTLSASLSLGEAGDRSFHLGAFAAVGGVATFLGAAAGGLVYARLPARASAAGLPLDRAQLLFLLGDAARLGAALLSLRVAAGPERAFALASTPRVRTLHPMRAATSFDCQACGACCANSAPNRREKYIDYVEVVGRDKLARRPDLLRRLTVVNDQGETHLKLVGREQRCAALEGELGKNVSCSIYEVRPRPCRVVEAGSDECLARRKERRIG